MKNILNLKVLVGMVLVAILLLGASLLVLMLKPFLVPLPDQAPASFVMTVIPAPTSTPRKLPPSPTTIPPTPPSTSTPAPGQFAVSVYVQVTGTGGDGLRLRAEPGLSAQPLALGYDSEVFRVADGPRQADGHTWWYLTASYDATRSGWAVQDYLTVIQSP